MFYDVCDAVVWGGLEGWGGYGNSVRLVGGLLGVGGVMVGAFGMVVGG